MIKGIIFDLDGTLVKLPINYDLILKKLSNLFDTEDKFEPLIPTIVKKSNENKKLIQQAFDLICNEEIISTTNFQSVDGAIDIINYFKNKNYKLALVTMQCKTAATKVLESMNLLNHFSSVITRDDSYDRPTQIKNSANFLALLPNEIMVVGDRIHDVHSAKKVGCDAILFNKKKLDSFKESIVISKISELEKIIK